jgi:hypothetical protein
MDRKTFMTTLGAAGLGLAVAAAGGASLALAQDEATPPVDESAEGPFAERLQMRQQLYADFTAALAAELGVASGDEVDAAIRQAMMTVVDQQEADGVLTFGQADAIKTLIATSDVPLGLGVGGGDPHGVFIRGHHAPGGHEGRFFPGRGEREDWTIRVADSAPADDPEEDAAETAEDEEDAAS